MSEKKVDVCEEIEVGLTNFHDGDKSLWTRTKGLCNSCDGHIWILTVTYLSKHLIDDMHAVCEVCKVSGDGASLMQREEDDVYIEPPTES